MVGLLATSGCSSNDGGADSGRTKTLTVFAASSLTKVFDSLARTYESEHPDVKVRISYGGSSALARQILAGAPADVFAAASRTTMAPIVAAGRSVGTVPVFASNKMIVVTPPGTTAVMQLKDLSRPSLIVVVCASEVPCGAAANSVFAKSGITPVLSSREPDVAGVLAKVESGDADAGVVYITDSLGAKERVRSIAIPDGQNQSTQYPIAKLSGGQQDAAAQDWIDLVTGRAGQELLKAAGFGTG